MFCPTLYCASLRIIPGPSISETNSAVSVEAIARKVMYWKRFRPGMRPSSHAASSSSMVASVLCVATEQGVDDAFHPGAARAFHEHDCVRRERFFEHADRVALRVAMVRVAIESGRGAGGERTDRHEMIDAGFARVAADFFVQGERRGPKLGHVAEHEPAVAALERERV